MTAIGFQYCRCTASGTNFYRKTLVIQYREVFKTRISRIQGLTTLRQVKDKHLKLYSFYSHLITLNAIPWIQYLCIKVWYTADCLTDVLPVNLSISPLQAVKKIILASRTLATRPFLLRGENAFLGTTPLSFVWALTEIREALWNSAESALFRMQREV